MRIFVRETLDPALDLETGQLLTKARKVRKQFFAKMKKKNSKTFPTLSVVLVKK